MTCSIHGGPSWTGYNRDKEGYVTYKMEFIVDHDSTDGPANIQQTPGLPVPGSFWEFQDDSDNYAFCYWANSISPMTAGEKNTKSKIEFTFSTKPENKFCRTEQVEDPLLEPPKISGSFSKYVEEATRDRFGRPILTSSWEQIRGTQNEWDRNRLSIKIEQNVGTALQGYILPGQLIDYVNSAPLWGLPARTIKLSSAPWEAKFWGSCAEYYTRTLEFDVRCSVTDEGTLETWDRDILDEGTKVLNGHWDEASGAWVLDNIGGAPPNPFNPTHFKRAQDRKGNPIKIVLNGQGLPANVVATDSNRFISVIDGNVGNSPGADNNKWIPLLSEAQTLADINDFDINVIYNRGELVTFGGLYFVCLENGIFHDTPPGDSWSQFTAFTNKGVWLNTTTYANGDWVLGVNQTGVAGNIHVEKYREADFTLLGIPLYF